MPYGYKHSHISRTPYPHLGGSSCHRGPKFRPPTTNFGWHAEEFCHWFSRFRHSNWKRLTVPAVGHQARRQVLRFERGNTNWGQDVCFCYMFRTNFSGHKKFRGQLHQILPWLQFFFNFFYQNVPFFYQSVIKRASKAFQTY